jgi:signal transduction histidine kinase
MDLGAIGKAAHEAATVLINDASRGDVFVPMAKGASSQLAVPIKVTSLFAGEEAECVLGVLNLESSNLYHFSSDDVRRLESIANIVSVTIENTRLMDRILSLLKAEADHGRELVHKKIELDEFIHTISHDLRNPLNNIGGFTDLLLAELNSSSESAGRYVERIRANVAVVSKLIDDLLELSRVGKVESQIIPVNMEVLIKEIKYDFCNAPENGNLEINCFNIPKQVNGNRHRLNQLLTNLISNAVKYHHPDRDPKVSITCIETDEEFRFSVTDNGLGIDEQYLKAIFSFGTRLKENKAQGTGAGLAICRKIVESHGGRIWVESEKDEGSTFYFTLPVR